MGKGAAEWSSRGDEGEGFNGLGMVGRGAAEWSSRGD